MDFPGLLLAALLCADVAAVALAVRSRVSRPLLALLAFALADELACLALHAALDGAPRPLAGWYRAGWHVSIALSLGWPAALVLATWGSVFVGPLVRLPRVLLVQLADVCRECFRMKVAPPRVPSAPTCTDLPAGRGSVARGVRGGDAGLEIAGDAAVVGHDWSLTTLLAFALADEVAQAALHAALDGAPRPLAGWARAGWHVSVALSLGWPAALAWAAQKTSGPNPRDRAASPETLPGFGPGLSPVGKSRLQVARTGVVTPEPVSSPGAKMTHEAAIVNLLAGGWVGLLAGLAIVYPPSRAGLRWTLLVWELACVALAWWGLWRARLRTWSAVEVCLVVLVACESAVVLVGPFASDPFTRWWIARAFYLGAWGAVCGVLVRSGARGRG